MSRTRIKSLLESGQIGSEVVVKGWVKAFRNNQFIQINDGSTINNIQAVIEFENFDEALVKKIAEDGFNATSDMPAFVLFKEFFVRYPEGSQGSHPDRSAKCQMRWANPARLRSPRQGRRWVQSARNKRCSPLPGPAHQQQ